MKRFYIGLLGIITILGACSRELEPITIDNIDNGENTILEPTVLPSNIPATFEAGFGAETRTNYAEGKATWVGNEQVCLLFVDDADTPTKQAWIAYNVSKVENEGRTATFTVADGQTEKAAVISSYTSTGIAFYPSTLANPSTGNYGDVRNGSLYVSIPTTQTGNYSDVIMFGTATTVADDKLTVNFKNATAILKVTVTGIPAEAAKFQLCSSDADHFPTGDFLIDRSAEAPLELTKGNYSKDGEAFTGASTITVNRSSEWNDGSQDFYLNIPTGAYAAGSITLKLLDGGDNVLMEKPIKSAFTFVRNKLITGITLATEWTTLGTGKFFDKFPENDYQNNVYADVTIQRNVANSNKYRIVNPYGLFETSAVNPSPYLTFTVDTSTGLVEFDDTDTGITIASHKILIKHPSKGGPKGGDTSDLSHNKVVTGSYESPSIVQLAPVYWYSDEDNGYRRNTVDNKLIIIFPGYDTDAKYDCSGLATAADLTFTVTGTNVSTARIGVHQYQSNALTNMNNCTPFTGSVGKLVTGAKETATGTYGRYIAYRIYNSDGAEIGFHNPTSKVTLYSISSDDATAVAGTYNIANDSKYPIVIATSDNCLMGNMKITQYNASGWNLTGNIYIYYTSSTMTLDDHQVFDIKGGTYYGIHNGSEGAPSGSLSFSVSESSGKKTFSRNGFGFGIATVSDGKATSYTATSHKWTNGTCYIVQQ